MLRVAKLFPALAIGVTLCSWANAEPILEGPQKEIDAIFAVFAQWGKARDAGDIEGIVAVHHPDMMIMTRNKALYSGRAGVRRFYSTFYDHSSERQLFSGVEEVRVFGEVAFVIGQFLALDAANSIEDPGYYLIVLRKNVSGDWLIYRDIDTPSPDGLALRPDE